MRSYACGPSVFIGERSERGERLAKRLRTTEAREIVGTTLWATAPCTCMHGQLGDGCVELTLSIMEESYRSMHACEIDLPRDILHGGLTKIRFMHACQV
jgi:hypothetical protein